MAAILRLFVPLLLLLIVDFCCTSNIVVTSVDNTARDIRTVLSALLSNATRYNDLLVKFGQLQNERILIFKKLNVSERTVKFAQNVSDLFSEYVEAVRKIKDKAENISKTYVFDADIKKDKFDYFNRMAQCSRYLKKSSILNNMEVTYNLSTVVVPEYIFNYSKDILNIVNATSGLDVEFRSNAKKIPNLLWQYICSKTVSRIFPG